MNTTLMPLRVPGGWAVLHHSFGDVDPIVCNGSIVNFEYYQEDLLLLQSIEPAGTQWAPKPNGYLLDLGWYPDADPNGAYRIRIIRGKNGHNILITTTSKDRQKIRMVIEQCLDLLNRGTEEQEILRLIAQV